MNDVKWTVFFGNEPNDEMPQEFDTYEEAEEYGKEMVKYKRASHYIIETAD